jgi:hypothetical protein
MKDPQVSTGEWRDETTTFTMPIRHEEIKSLFSDLCMNE